MFGSKTYIGIAMDNRTLETARLSVSGKKFQLLDFDRLYLVDALSNAQGSRVKPSLEAVHDKEASDEIFGFKDSEKPTEASDSDVVEELNLDDLDVLDNLDDLDDLDSLEQEGTGSGVNERDIVDEAGNNTSSNEMLLYNYLSSVGRNQKHYVGMNIRSGNTVLQYRNDIDYKTVKKKEIRELVENRLQSVHGSIPGTENYSYYVRGDGTLVIASLDKEPASLALANRFEDVSHRTRLFINDILPDESALVGLFRLNYPLIGEGDEEKITGLVQFRENRARLLFLKGHEVLQVPPVIIEGTKDKGFLNTVFSKILFQLDTGEIPGLDRIVLCDNTLGNESIAFFKKNFPELDVNDFQLNPDIFDIAGFDSSKYSEFTTAIALAVGASGMARKQYPALSFIPPYVIDRQKTFQLQWHGVLLLIAVGLSPILLNHTYQQNLDAIDNLQAENTRFENLIRELEPVVQETVMLEETLAAYQTQLNLLEELSEGNIRWTVSFDRFNGAVQQIGGLWITALQTVTEGINIEGVSMSESRIPALARQFADVTLMNVRKDETREHPIFRFSMRINKVVGDESLFSPQQARKNSEINEPSN